MNAGSLLTIVLGTPLIAALPFITNGPKVHTYSWAVVWGSCSCSALGW